MLDVFKVDNKDTKQLQITSRPNVHVVEFKHIWLINRAFLSLTLTYIELGNNSFRPNEFKYTKQLLFQ